MKTTRKILAIVMVIAMIMSMGVLSAFAAQSVDSGDGGSATITIKNAAKGETYSVVKVFDATLSEDKTSIVYSGAIPDALKSVFTTNDSGNIVVVSDKTDKEVTDAVTAWANTQNPTAFAESDGSVLTFTGLEYGYYAVISTQGAAVTVTSTNPNATVTDKNTKDITAVKTVEKNSYSIGDTVNYTATFTTVNYYNEKQVVKYTITDTLPKFLSNVAIDSIEITETSSDGTSKTTPITGKNFINGEVEIEWATKVDESSNPVLWTSNYNNGATITVKYHGTLTSVTNINTADKNTVTIQPSVTKDDGTPGDKEPSKDEWKDSAEIYTYAAALKKTDGTNALAGAKFKVKGLTVTKTADGVYTVVSYNPANDADLGNEMEVDANGKLYIVGLASDVKLAVTETEAPAGYNKTDDTIELTPQVMTTAIYTASGTIYYDADGNVVDEVSSSTTNKTVEKNLNELDTEAVEVVNNKGTVLPSTGGMGTALLIGAGSVIALAAALFLVTKKRVKNAEV